MKNTKLLRDGSVGAASTDVATASSDLKGCAHTPGPWKAVIGTFPGGELRRAEIEAGPGKWIGSVAIRPHTINHVAANARLIASAPELLAVCQLVAVDMRRHVESLRLSTGCPDLTPKQVAWATHLEAAIAKAEGR